jgi:hypothetical protein
MRLSVRYTYHCLLCIVYYFSVDETSICVGGSRLAQISEGREASRRRTPTYHCPPLEDYSHSGKEVTSHLLWNWTVIAYSHTRARH